MKYLSLLSLVFSINSFAMTPVTTGEAIKASQINSIVTRVQSLDQGLTGAGVLGEVKVSILTEAQFQAISGTCWVLMNGRNIAGKDLSTLAGITNIPDARGLALRGKNNGRSDGLHNPDGDLNLGQIQTDMYGQHNHIGGHARALGYPYNDQAPWGTWQPGPGRVAAQDGGTFNRGFAYTSTMGGNETRMKNVTVNYFIKIHNTCN